MVCQVEKKPASEIWDLKAQYKVTQENLQSGVSTFHTVNLFVALWKGQSESQSSHVSKYVF